MYYEYSTKEYLRAHQYLYYVLGQPVLSDYEYDRWGHDNALEDYKGGSDLESSYSQTEKELARLIQTGNVPKLPN